VRERETVSPRDPTIFRHEERSWVSLLTCQGYDERSGTYRYRYLVRAVLVRVEADGGSSAGREVRLRGD
jgi:hypothetical protein